MGGNLSRNFWKSRNIKRLLIVGLDNSGKSTLLSLFLAQNVSCHDRKSTTKSVNEEIQYKKKKILVTVR